MSSYLGSTIIKSMGFLFVCFQDFLTHLRDQFKWSIIPYTINFQSRPSMAITILLPGKRKNSNNKWLHLSLVNYLAEVIHTLTKRVGWFPSQLTIEGSIWIGFSCEHRKKTPAKTKNFWIFNSTEFLIMKPVLPVSQ